MFLPPSEWLIFSYFYTITKYPKYSLNLTFFWECNDTPSLKIAELEKHNFQVKKIVWGYMLFLRSNYSFFSKNFKTFTSSTICADVSQNIVKFIWGLWSPHSNNASSSKSGLKFRLGKIPEYAFRVTL